MEFRLGPPNAQVRLGKRVKTSERLTILDYKPVGDREPGERSTEQACRDGCEYRWSIRVVVRDPLRAVVVVVVVVVDRAKKDTVYYCK